LKVLVLGASGLVGANTLRLALAHPDIEHVIAPTRKALPPHKKLTNPVSDRLQPLIAKVPEWAADALICSLGTTIAKAGSKAAFREVDYVLPLQFISGQRDDLRLGESVVLRLSKVLGPILPKKFHINPAANIAGALIESVIAALPGCHFRFSESLS